MTKIAILFFTSLVLLCADAGAEPVNSFYTTGVVITESIPSEYPSFQALLDLATQYRNVPVTIGMATFYMPSEGAGGDGSTGKVIPTHTNATAASNIALARAAGISIDYYIPLANRSWHPDMSVPPTKPQIKAAIDAITLYYPAVNGVFLDECDMINWQNASVDPKDIFNYAVTYAQSKGLQITANIGQSGYPGTFGVAGWYPFRYAMVESYVTSGGTPNWGGSWHIPTPAELAAKFSSIPIEKRLSDFYLFYNWGGISGLNNTWLTSANYTPYLSQLGAAYIIPWDAGSGTPRNDAHIQEIPLISATNAANGYPNTTSNPTAASAATMSASFR